jgi:hypothetical protein
MSNFGDGFGRQRRIVLNKDRVDTRIAVNLTDPRMKADRIRDVLNPNRSIDTQPRASRNAPVPDGDH